MHPSRVPATLPKTEEEPSPGVNEPARLFRGVTAITAAKVWFVVAGYAVYFALTRMLGPRDFGLYAVVTSVVSVFNNVVVAVTVQAVSRFTARDEGSAGSVLRAGRILLAALGALIFIALEALAPLAGEWLHDRDLVAPLRVVALVVPAYALYAVNVGFLNGLRRFTHQAALDGTYSTLRAVLQIGAVALGFGVMGAAAGFATAAFLILGISVLVVLRVGRPRGPFRTRELLEFGGWFAALTLAANLVLTADLWIVKWQSPPEIANQQAGLYRAALTVSQLLYQLLIPMALVLFPSLSHLGRSPDPERARTLVRGALRYLAVTVLPAAAVIAVMGREIIGLLYQKEYVPGGAWLDALGPAYAAWTVAYLLAIALSGAGHVRSGVGVLLLGLAGQVAVAIPLCRRLGPHGAAWADLFGMSLALAAGLVVALRRFGDIIPWASLARGLALAAVLAFFAARFPAAGWHVVPKGLALAAAGALLLLASGELKRPARRGDLPGAA
jgi:O-antigen/teichoic acid export membrane protein